MKWAEGRPAGVQGTWTYENIKFYDLLDDDKTLLGYVREDKRDQMFMAIVNTSHLSVPRAPFPVVATLEEAKAQLIHHFVLQRLEDT